MHMYLCKHEKQVLNGVFQVLNIVYSDMVRFKLNNNNNNNKKGNNTEF
jgi:hypothetical protein